MTVNLVADNYAARAAGTVGNPYVSQLCAVISLTRGCYVCSILAVSVNRRNNLRFDTGGATNSRNYIILLTRWWSDY